MPRLNPLLPLLCVAVLILAGCVGTPYPGVHTESLSKVAQPGEGYVMMSFAFSGTPAGVETNVIPRFDGYVFKIRSVDDPYALYEIGLGANISSGYYRDFDAPRGMGFVFAEPLPAGEYEIYGWELALYDWGPSTVISSAQEASIRFAVAEGSYTYLGRIECQHEYETLVAKGIDSLRPSGATFSWSDHEEADRFTATMKFPHLLACDAANAKIGTAISQLNGPARKSRY